LEPLHAWPEFLDNPPSETIIQKWSKLYPGYGWGALCGWFVIIDIDVDSRKEADRIQKIVEEKLGITRAVPDPMRKIVSRLGDDGLVQRFIFLSVKPAGRGADKGSGSDAKG